MVSNDKSECLQFRETPVNITNVHRLTKLERFALLPFDDSYDQLYPLMYNDDTFQKLVHLKSLVFHIPLIDKDLVTIVKHLVSYEVFDISFSRGMSLYNLTKTLARINKTTIQSLCLRKFQQIGGGSYTFELKMNNLTGNENDTLYHLSELDISYNGFTRIHPGIFHLAPNLTSLDASGNVLLDAENIPFMLEGLTHPTIKELILGEQSWSYVTSKDPEPQHNEATSKCIQHDMHKQIVQCANHASGMNISTAVHDSDILCTFLKCVTPVFFRDYPCSLLNPIGDTYDYNCMFYNKLPIGKNLKTFLFHRVYKDYYFTGLGLDGNICFAENGLETLVLSANEQWVKPVLTHLMKNLINVKGLDNLTTLNLDKNNLQLNLQYFREANLKKLRNLNLSENKIQISNTNKSICRDLPDLRHFYLRSNNITSVPSDLFKECKSLERIILYHNNLTANCIGSWNLNGSGRISRLDVRFNHLEWTFIDNFT